MPIDLSLSGPDLIKLIEEVRASDPFDDGVPDRVEIDFYEQQPTAEWPAQLVEAKQSFSVEWETGEEVRQSLSYYPGASIHVKIDLPPAPDPVQDWLALLDFEIAIFRTLHDDWRDIDPEYSPPTLPTLHYPYGWAMAFKGDARRRIVSERWLIHNPAHVERRGDLIFIQFHDPTADAVTSLAQAKPAHLAFSTDNAGGVINPGALLRHDFKGVYDERTGVLKIPVLGRTVPLDEMLDACAVRFEGEMHDGKTVKNIGYVFLDEDEIGDHLRELWLRELECWTIREGREVRLDVDYVYVSL